MSESDRPSTQSDKFVKAARELGCDGSEERFDEALRKIGKQKPKDDRVGGGASRKQKSPA